MLLDVLVDLFPLMKLHIMSHSLTSLTGGKKGKDENLCYGRDRPHYYEIMCPLTHTKICNCSCRLFPHSCIETAWQVVRSKYENTFNADSMEDYNASSHYVIMDFLVELSCIMLTVQASVQASSCNSFNKLALMFTHSQQISKYN